MYFKFPATKVQILINNQYITFNHSLIWRKASLSQDLWEYMIKSFKWKDSTPDKVWRKIVGPTLTKFNENDRTCIQKLLFKKLKTNHFLSLKSEYSKEICPSCGQEGETIIHVLRCTHPMQRDLRNQMYQKLELLMKETCTPKEVSVSMMKHLKGWIDNNLEQT